MEKVISTAFIAIILLSIFPANTANAELPVDRYIDYLEDFIEYLENIIEEKGVELPQDLKENLQQAKQLLMEARNSSDEEALILVIRAGRLVAPVAKYILSEEVFSSVDMEVLETSIKVRIEMIDRALEKLNQLEEMGLICEEGGSVELDFIGEPCVELDIDGIRETLNSVRSELESLLNSLDDLDSAYVADRIQELDRILKNVFIDVRDAVSTVDSRRGIQTAMTYIFTGIVYRIALQLNRTLSYLEAGDVDRAMIHLYSLFKTLDFIIERLDDFDDIALKIGVGEKPLEKINNATVILKMVKNRVDAAREALSMGDIESAITYVEEAIQILEDNIDTLIIISPGLKQDLMENILKIKVKIERLRMKLIDSINKLFQNVITQLENLEKQLDTLQTMYESGEISRMQYLIRLNMIEVQLRALKNLVERYPNTPTDIIERIDQLLDRVETMIQNA